MKNKKRWLSDFSKCDICHGEIRGKVSYFVDGATIYGPFALMCPTCHEKFGRGLGTGKGQKYDGTTGEKLED